MELLTLPTNITVLIILSNNTNKNKYSANNVNTVFFGCINVNKMLIEYNYQYYHVIITEKLNNTKKDNYIILVK